MAAKLVGASVWEEALYEHLTSHENNERDLLGEYQKAADESESPAFQYLVSLIIEDEIRHHRTFRDLAAALRTEAELRPEQPAIPRLEPFGIGGNRIVELTEQLLEREESDARELRRLSKELRDVKDTTLWDLLVKLMEMDTAKHVEILEFARRHARKGPKS
jgi:rubrerythrin